MTLLLPPSRYHRRRSLLQAQVDYCLRKGVTLRLLDGGRKGGAKAYSSSSSSSSRSGSPLQECYRVSLPYAGTSIELQAVLYAGQGGEYGDEDEEEEEQQQKGDNEVRMEGCLVVEEVKEEEDAGRLNDDDEKRDRAYVS
jgi:hypothetical protein